MRMRPVISIIQTSILMSLGENFYNEDLLPFTATQTVKFIGKSISIQLPITLGNWELTAINHPEVK